MPSADIRVNALVPPQNVVINVAANFSNASTGGEVTFAWTLLDQPEGPPDALVPAGPTAALTPLKEGSYLVQLVVNSGTNTEARDIAKIDVRNFIDGRSYPAAGETVEQNMARGWAEEANRLFGDLTSIRKDPGQVAGVIAVNGTTANQTVLFISGTVEIKATLPGAERVPLFDIANGSSTTEMAGSLFLLTKSVTNTAAPSAPVANDVIWARADGMVYGVNLGGGAVGDSVYVSDAGSLALLPGTVGRSVGQIVAVRGAVVDIQFEGHKQLLQQAALIRFSSRDCTPNIAANFVWPLQYGYAPVPAIDGVAIHALANGVVTKYKVSRPGRWSRLIAWCYFHADPRTVQVIVYKNGVATTLAVTLNSAGADTEDTQTDYNESHAVTFAEGDTIDIRVKNIVPLDTFDQIRGISATVLEQLFG